MKKRLTELACERARPIAGKRVALFDGLVPGLALRLGTSGAKSWSLIYRIGRKQHRVSLGRYPLVSLTEARAKARELLARAQAGISPDTDPAIARRQQKLETVADLVADYLERYQRRNNLRRAADVERMLNSAVLPSWGHRLISSITFRDGLDLIDGIADRGAGVMANRVAALIKRMFGWAVGRGILTANPLAGLKPPVKERSRDRVLADDELTAVWRTAATIGWPFGPAIQLMILTAGRRSEVAGLTWREIDRERQLWVKPAARMKAGRVHELPLSAAALDVLDSLPRIENAGDFVFPGRRGGGHISGFSELKLKLDRLSGVASWRYHDLRRSAASGMARIGTAPHVIGAILDHSPSATLGAATAIYLRHRHEAEQRAALERWGRHVVALVEGKPGANVIRAA
jgi:integrase